MSDMKCPMCNTNLEVLVGGANAVLGCPRCRYKASDGVWQELMRTRNALDDAINILKEIDWCAQDYAKAQEALAKITAPNQEGK